MAIIFGLCALGMLASYVLAMLEFKRLLSKKGFRFFLAVCVLLVTGVVGLLQEWYWSIPMSGAAFFFAVMTVVAQLIRVCEPQRRENESK